MDLYLLIGFLFAAYAVVANDSVQTLGTFLSSNKDTKWYWILLYIGSILWAVFIIGWYVNGGDVSWGRLEHVAFPEQVNILHALAPIALLFLTRYGIPASTTFLVLSAFATADTVGEMVVKSMIGYSVAAVAAFFIWRALTRIMNEHAPASPRSRTFWVRAQWLATGFLWSQWLMHDMANIAVYLPRELSFGMMMGALVLLTVFLGVMLYFRGGKIQHIVLNKTSTTFIRSATIIDIVFAVVLWFFKDLNTIPMSTTWVFVGLLAGREMALRNIHKDKDEAKVVFPMLIKDFLKILFGLAVSVLIAFGATLL